MNLFTLFNGACSDQIAFCWRTRMAWNALDIGRSPLEAMAYDAESEFASSTLIFNAEKLIADKLGL